MHSSSKQILLSYRSHIIMLIIYSIITFFGYVLVRTNLINNFTKIGKEVANFYAMEEEKSFSIYKALLNRISLLIDNTSGLPDKESWMEDIFTKINISKFDQNLELYAVIDDKFITGRGWEHFKDPDYQNAEWYQKAAAASDEIIFTDVYIDNFTHLPTITIAKSMENPNDVIALDISAENYSPPAKSSFLPHNSNYYLFGVSGNLFYFENDLGLDTGEITEHAEDIYTKIKNQTLTTDRYIIDPHGIKKLIFYAKTNDNLLVIVTIPHDTLLHELNQLLAVTLFIIFTLFLITFINIYFAYKTNKKYENITKTITFLGNIYYAIFLVDTARGTFITIKYPEDLINDFNKSNDYNDLIDVAKKAMEEDVAVEFSNSFSLENILKVAEEGTDEFGGEFKRVLGNDFEWISIRMFLEHIKDNNTAILCFKKITQEKEVQMRQYELLTSAVDNAKKSEKARTDFFARMSHDMRTPLNGIIGYTELGINHSTTMEETKDYLNKIKLSSHQLLELVNYILELSRIEKGNVDETKTKINIREIITHCVQPFHSLALTEIRKFSVQFDIQNEYILAPAFKLIQILNNLLSNAFKYSNKGDNISVLLKQLQSKKEDQKQIKYQLIVKDTGRGMTKEFLEKIFIPYQRETMFGAKDILGTGLGMPIVQNIVTSLNGEINIDSELNVGTKVSVVIPFDISEEVSAPKDMVKINTNEINLEGVTVLLVEDNKVNMEIAQKLLTFKGMTVEKAWNGEEAVEAFIHSEENHFDIILMDLQMPKLNGLEAAVQIRHSSHPNAKTVPIVAVSANAFTEDIARSLQAGMNDHISKPLDIATLYKTIYTHTSCKEKK